MTSQTHVEIPKLAGASNDTPHAESTQFCDANMTEWFTKILAQASDLQHY